MRGRITLVFVLFLGGCSHSGSTSKASCTERCSIDSDCSNGQTCNLGVCSDHGTCSCKPGEFLTCSDSTNELQCNTSGNGATSTSCGAPGCNGITGRCNQCTPNTPVCSADGTTLQMCDVTGVPQPAEACTLPCVAGTDVVPAHCGYISPMFLPSICDTQATIASATFDNLIIDTASASMCSGGIVGQDPDSLVNQDICVERADTITIGNVRAVARSGVPELPSRVLAFVADHDLQLVNSGAIDVAARGHESGAGYRGFGGSASGGAGFRDPGGRGGTSGGVPGGAHHPPFKNIEGGDQAATSDNGTGGLAGGGGGGGAVLLVSCRGKVTIAGTINANGGGGNAGFAPATGTIVNAAGGGAGGYIVIEGAAVVITGRLYANGGGGGGGCCPGPGSDGQDGQLSTTPAAGGPSTNDGGGNGGTSLPPTNAVGVGGGGGGAGGYLQVFTPSGVTPTLTPQQVSPAFETPQAVTTR
jgi:hypothetical protein